MLQPSVSLCTWPVKSDQLVVMCRAMVSSADSCPTPQDEQLLQTGGPFILGQEISVVDVACFPYAASAYWACVDISEMPHLKEGTGVHTASCIPEPSQMEITSPQVPPGSVCYALHYITLNSNKLFCGKRLLGTKQHVKKRRGAVTGACICISRPFVHAKCQALYYSILVLHALLPSAQRRVSDESRTMENMDLCPELQNQLLQVQCFLLILFCLVV